MLRDLKARLVALTLRLLLCLLRNLPIPLAYGGASLLARVASWVVVPIERRRCPGRTSVRRNLQIAFGAELSEAAIRRMTYLVLRHLGWLVIDFARLPRFTRADMERACEPADIAEIQAHHAGPGGLIVVTGHFGVFELLGQIGPHMDCELATVVHPFRNPYLDALVTEHRCAHGQALLRNKNILRALKERLDAGGIVGILVDENTKRKPLYLPFFGTLATVNSAVAGLHRLTKAPIMVVGVFREAPGVHRFEVLERIAFEAHEDRRAYERGVMERILASQEAAIRRWPEQWLWNMRRWRSRPPGEVLDDAGLPPRVAPPILPEELREL